MGFEYTLRHPSGTLDLAGLAAMEQCVTGLGGRRTDGSSLVLGPAVVIHIEEGGLLMVLQSLDTLRSPAIRALLETARIWGLRLYETGEDVPLLWEDV